MKIAVEARALSHQQPGGFKTYTTNLVQALAQIDSTNEYTLYVDRLPGPDVFAAHANVALHVIRPVGGWANVPLREQVLLPLHLLRSRPDLVHCPCATAPVLGTSPLVATIHDTIEFFEPRRSLVFSREGVRRALMSDYSRWVQRRVARRASLVITGSNQSKRDIVQQLGVPEEKVRIIPNAHAPRFRPRNESHSTMLRERYHLPQVFALGLVSAAPRKNALGLLRIYRLLPVGVRGQYPLVLVLTHPLLRPAIAREVERLGLEPSVCLLPAVDDEELALLFNAATVLVFPSLYEGFGLPVLEAMACGTPVVASSLTSIPEVVGDAAELADPRDEAAFAGALSRVLQSSGRRAELVEAGLRRAARYSWERTARLTLDVYREVAGHGLATTTEVGAH